MAKLTKQDAINFPANFLYIWASDKFLAQLDSKSAKIIRMKRENQKVVLSALSEEDNPNLEKYKAFLEQVKASFVEKYGVTPAEALVVLASGGSIAGKNWKEGVYGIGATKRSNFSQNTDITVEPDTGLILYKGVPQVCTPVYKKDQVTNQTCVIDGNTYSSIYDKSTKKFYAYQFCPGDGNGVKYNAAGEKLLIGNMTNDMWQDILSITSSFGDMILKFVQAFVSIFGGGLVPTSETSSGDIKTIDPKKVAPKQSDGFIFNAESGLGILAIGGLAAWLILRRKRG